MSKPHLDQIEHDIYVIDTVIYCINKYTLLLSDIKSEKELRHLQGFGSKGHEPDFLFNQDGKTTCVEIELHLKAKERLLKNIKQNYTNYDAQIWVIPKDKTRIYDIVKKAQDIYTDIEIIELEEIKEYIKGLG